MVPASVLMFAWACAFGGLFVHLAITQLNNSTSKTFLFRYFCYPNRLSRNYHVVQIKMQVLRRRLCAAVIDVDPDRFNLQFGNVSKAQVHSLESELAVDPRFKGAVLPA